MKAIKETVPTYHNPDDVNRKRGVGGRDEDGLKYLSFNAVNSCSVCRIVLYYIQKKIIHVLNRGAVFMITYLKGDMFNSPAKILVNTVNTVGVMGKGVALEFKNRYPEMFYRYKQLCEAQDVKYWNVVFMEKGKEVGSFISNQGTLEKSFKIGVY